MIKLKQVKSACEKALMCCTLLIVTGFLKSCKHNEIDVVSTNYFQIEASSRLNLTLEVSPELTEGYILINNSDTLYYQIGINIPSLTEKDPDVVYFPNGTNFENIDTSNIRIARKINYDMDRFRKQNIKFIRINGHEAKITYPRNHSDGITGIYIDSLYVGDTGGDVVGIISFSMYALQLNEEAEKNLVAAFETLLFNNPSKSQQ